MARHKDYDRLIAAYTYPGVLDEAAVTENLQKYVKALGIEREVVRIRQDWTLREYPALARTVDAILDDFAARTGRVSGQSNSDARAAWAARDAWDTWDAWDAWDAWAAWAARAARAARAAWDAWDARAAWAATFDLTAKARAEQQGVELNADTIQGIMAPVIAELWRSQIDVFRRAIEAGPHGDARV